MPSRRPVITVRRIDAKYIHQETVWPTQWQPFIPWVHEETDYMGECDMRGTVRDAKDAQRVYNVNVSSLSEAVNDAPKNRVVGYKRVPTRFVLKYTRRLAHLELGGVDLDLAVEDDVLPLDRADMTKPVGVEREVRRGGNP